MYFVEVKCTEKNQRFYKCTDDSALKCTTKFTNTLPTLHSLYTYVYCNVFITLG